MGTLVPEDFPLASLRNDAERRVVEAFRDGLGDRWLILPDVGIAEHRDRQCDVVLVNEDVGILDVEVKGHKVAVREGEWVSNGKPLKPQPFAQARENAYALRRVLRPAAPGLEHLGVEYAVAFPNTRTVKGRLPPDVKAAQVLTDHSLEDPAEAIEAAMAVRWNQALSHQQVEAIVGVLRPDVEFSWDPNSRIEAARARLDELCAHQLRPLESLDDNRRVLAVGASGTGKTRLAMAWARNAAVHRDERVLLTCYNEPLADVMRERLGDLDGLQVAPILRLILGLEGPPPLPIPPDADQEWWDLTPVGHAMRHWDEVTERFDTIVVDEAQDFSPAWMGLLESLLDQDGPKRLLVVADPAQELYPRGFRLPRADDGWTVCTLATNCRNTQGIGSLLRRRLNGAPSPATGPGSTGVTWLPAETGEDACTAAAAEVDRLLGQGRSPGQLLVLTCASAVRNRLRTEAGLLQWEERGGGGVVCENVHRAKGLEADTVVLVVDADHSTDELLYVGIGRAVSELVVVAPAATARRLGLDPPVPAR